MRKITSLLSCLLLLFSLHKCFAGSVNEATAKTVAHNFYSQLYTTPIQSVTLAYTGINASGNAVYYIYNINEQDGFVIVSADDAATPVLGYSDKGSYNITEQSPEFSFWMGKYSNKINYIQQNHLLQTTALQNKWQNLVNNVRANQNQRVARVQSVNPLTQTTWGQYTHYNAMCPGGSYTGCVATTMAQVMKYWNYPSHGIGSHCYNDTTPGFLENYGKLCAYFDTTNYDWSAMPSSLAINNNEVDRLMYDCGVSVNMNYSPAGSGSVVLTALDSTTSAQIAYVKYFGYDSTTLQGLIKSNYSDNTWDSIIENELINNRVVEYVGHENAITGHTWVCDGFNTGGYFHMNWGWLGNDNGYYTLDSLNPAGQGEYDSNEQALIGIQPGVPLSVKNIIQPVSSAVYPNPNNGNFIISVPGEQSNELFIYNALGQKIYSQSGIQHQVFNVNLGSQPVGIYLYRILSVSGDLVGQGKLIIQQ